MDINELLKGLDCSCGKHHTCPMEAVYIEADAARHLPALCGEAKQILLVADENTFAAAGDSVLKHLAEKEIRKVIFPGDRVLIPDEKAVETVQKALADAQMIVGIGSGVISDLCKYVSFESHIPYIIVATAPSMDGYASTGAAMIAEGMKVTYSVGLPKAILAPTEVLQKAPMRMIQAGYGDIIGKFSALNDWKLSQCVNGEYFCPVICDMTMEQVQRTLRLAEGIRNREEEAVRTLMEALVIVGILMSFATNSRPASGSEHHLSHYFEITGILDGTEYFPHGIDVAYSTVVTADLREQILAKPFPEQRYFPGRDAVLASLSAIYGPIAPSCLALQEKAGTYERDRMPIYREKEEKIRQILSEMPSSREIAAMLAAVGLDEKELEELYGEKKIRSGIFYAKDLKDRYTVLWIYYDFFGGKENE